MSEDIYADVQAAIDQFDGEKRRVMLVRLAMHDNNGAEHFDHGDPGYSWLCLRCAKEPHAPGGPADFLALLGGVA